MKLRLEIKTPPGQASGTERKLRLVILGTLRKPATTWTSPENNAFYWELDTTPKDYIRITRNVGKFSGAMSYLLDKPTFKKAITGLADKPEDYDNLRAMLTDGTTITIIKQATAEELTQDGTSFWDKIKKTFKKS